MTVLVVRNTTRFARQLAPMRLLVGHVCEMNGYVNAIAEWVRKETGGYFSLVAFWFVWAVLSVRSKSKDTFFPKELVLHATRVLVVCCNGPALLPGSR